MPAVSKSQARLMGYVHAVQKGEARNAPTKIKSIAKTIDPQDAKDFASTKHTNLPEKVARDIIRRAAIRALAKQACSDIKRGKMRRGFSKSIIKKAYGLGSFGWLGRAMGGAGSIGTGQSGGPSTGSMPRSRPTFQGPNRPQPQRPLFPASRPWFPQPQLPQVPRSQVPQPQPGGDRMPGYPLSPRLIDAMRQLGGQQNQPSQPFPPPVRKLPFQPQPGGDRMPGYPLSPRLIDALHGALSGQPVTPTASETYFNPMLGKRSCDSAGGGRKYKRGFSKSIVKKAAARIVVRRVLEKKAFPSPLPLGALAAAGQQAAGMPWWAKLLGGAKNLYNKSPDWLKNIMPGLGMGALAGGLYGLATPPDNERDDGLGERLYRGLGYGMMGAGLGGGGQALWNNREALQKKLLNDQLEKKPNPGAENNIAQAVPPVNTSDIFGSMQEPGNKTVFGTDIPGDMGGGDAAMPTTASMPTTSPSSFNGPMAAGMDFMKAASMGSALATLLTGGQSGSYIFPGSNRNLYDVAKDRSLYNHVFGRAAGLAELHDNLVREA